MPQEYVNKQYNSRKKVIIRTLLFMGVLILLALFQHLFFPDTTNTSSTYHSRHHFSESELLFIIIASSVIASFYMFYATIVTRLVVDVEKDELLIEYIPRFRQKAVIKQVKLSETYLQFDSATKDNKFFHKKSDDYFVLYLNHKTFGRLKVSALEFGSQIEDVFKAFQTLKTHAANNVWRHRRKSMAKKHSGIRNPDSGQN